MFLFLIKQSAQTLGSRVLAILNFFLNWGRFLKSLGTTALEEHRVARQTKGGGKVFFTFFS